MAESRPEEQYFTTAEVAKILKLNPFTVLVYIRTGKLRASKVGKSYRITKSDIDAFIARGYLAAKTPLTPNTKETEQ